MLSLVTACMNRESHLRRSLPHWLALPGVDEIILVDWSTRERFDDLLDLDPRIRLVRVLDEPRWILSYAYNVGVAYAQGDVILKCDADCLPHAVVAALVPDATRFYAGNWRTGRSLGKACVNGQCLFTRDAFEKVNGYSEVIRTYGRDDEDLYARLAASGCRRETIAAGHLDFLPHDDHARLAQQIAPPAPSSPADPEAFLRRQTAWHEMFNLVITAFHPWGPWYPQARYATCSSLGSHRLVELRRDRQREIPLSDTLQQTARGQALRNVAGQLAKLSPAQLARLDDDACLRLVARAASSATGKPAAA